MSLSQIARTAGLAVLVTTLAGCAQSPIPVAENFPLTVQKKVRSAGHWELIAQDVVSQTVGMMRMNGVDPGSRLYVSTPVGASHFDKAFRELLISEFVSRGHQVMMGPEGAVEVSYSTNTVKHKSDRPHFIPGQYTMLAAGLAAAYGISTLHADVAIAAGVAAMGGADYANSVWTGGPTQTELLLTTSLTYDNRYVARKTDVYYVEDPDAYLFARDHATKTMKVVAE